MVLNSKISVIISIDNTLGAVNKDKGIIGDVFQWGIA